MYELNWFGKLIFAIPVTFISIVMIGVYWNDSVSPYLKKRRIIKMEMSRASASRKKFWKRKLYKNYLRLIPIVGNLMKKKKKGKSHFRSHRRHRHHRHHRHHSH